MKEVIDMIKALNVEELRQWLINGNNPNRSLGDNYNFSILQYVLDELDDDEFDNQKGSNIVSLLIEYNVDVNQCCGNKNELPIFKAIKENNLEITKLLLKAGANIDFIDNIGESPLRYAV
ncbi:ankyrin repeat domain-containing protein [Spirochaeta cellobiosiphila]|uniref:ankyrin repeat domain-containing protein n=1 Tax=Spirochaeta cellobiosiphila TaxID=504483 RepID=UPI00041E5544|nr:ankyrin repeat domain-containing protein [Spirochaeta cellobiosiphila]